MRTIAPAFHWPLFLAALALSPDLAMAQCRTPFCPQKQVVVPPVQLVPIAVQVPTYSVSYDGNIAALIAELRGIREEIAGLRGATSPQALSHISIITNNCARCHEAKVAGGKGGSFVMLDAKGVPPFSLPEKRRIEELVKAKKMPPDRPLSDSEQEALFRGLKQPIKKE